MSHRSGWSRRGSRATTRAAHPDRAVPAPAAAFREGEQLDGRYRIEGLIGQGGMGAVYRAYDALLEEPIAVKVLHGAGPAHAELLRREVVLARRVTHENVVRVHHLGVEPNGRVYFTMELVVGESLRRWLDESPHPRTEAPRIARQICDGLAAAHRAGVVHRDLKPANVMLRWGTEGPTALLSDFGIARALSEQSPTGGVAGTPMYMAPEQRLGLPTDARTDLYSLGVLLFELLSGQRLFRSAEAAEAAAIDPERIRSLIASRAAADLIIAALDAQPERRPASAARFAGALRSVDSPSGALADTEADGAAVLSRARPRLAVAPFRMIDPAHEGYLGAGLSEELIRVLSSLRDIAVFSGGATAPYDGDARALGRRLGADAVVYGTVQRAGTLVRVSASLLDIDSGRLLWAHRFDASYEDVFELQEALSLRICEALRVRWVAMTAVPRAPAEAFDLYYRARRQLREGAVAGPDGAAALLERCLDLAPDLEPALGLRAIACCRAWFLPSAAGERDWQKSAQSAASVALERAPEIAESQLAAGIIAAQMGDYDTSVRALVRAIELAPTLPEAHDYLARLQIEAGRCEDAIAHFELAHGLDPTLVSAPAYLARYHALRGNRAPADELYARNEYARIVTLPLKLRIASWFEDRDAVRRCLDDIGGAVILRREFGVLASYGRYILGELTSDEVEEAFARDTAHTLLSGRVASNLHQFMVEGHALHGADTEALRHLEAAAAGALIDRDWLARCPLLARLRARPELPEIEARIRRRAEPIWRA